MIFDIRRSLVVLEQGPDIEKTRSAHNSKYAGLAETIKIIGPIMERYGLSHSWKTSQDGDLITVTCYVTHIQGHSESTSLPGAPDASGSKNSIQAVGSTVSYLERYTLFAILGLASTDQDNDGGPRIAPVSDEQALRIESYIKDNDINMDEFKAWLETAYGSPEIAEIPAVRFGKVMNMLKQKSDASS